MELWTETAWYVELLANTLLFVLPTLAGVAVAGGLGAQTIKVVRAGWRDVVRPAVDQASDPVVLYLAAKSGRDPQDVSKFLVENGDQIVSMLPETAGEARP